MSSIATLPATFDRTVKMPFVVDFAHWLATHRTAVVVAGLLGSAYPMTSLVAGLGNVSELSVHLVGAAVAKALALALLDWPAFLLAGYFLQRWHLSGWRAALAAFALALGAASIIAVYGYVNSWGDMLESTQNAGDFALDSMAQATSMALLFFAHLQHSRAHVEAADRLAAAKVAQREARRRLAFGELHAVQARIDPQLLFDMLDAVRRAYESDAGRAEQLLDELVAFLRAALPRLHDSSSTLPREAQTAHALARLHALSQDAAVELSVALSVEAKEARFPPGVLLPLLNEALRLRAGACALTAERRGADTVVVLGLPAMTSQATVERARTVLADLYDTAADLVVGAADDSPHVTIRLPYERA